ncbi:hypothetical protein D3C73_933900 [compost metagenome]
MHHAVDGRADEARQLEGHLHAGAGRKVLLDVGQQLLQALDDDQRVADRRGVQAEVDGRFAVHQATGIGGRRPQFHRGHIAQPHQRIAIALDDQVAEFRHIHKVSVDLDVGHHIQALGLAGRRLHVVVAQRLCQFSGRNAARRHAVGIQPDTHRQLLTAVEFHAGHAVYRRQLRLHHARQVIGQRRQRQRGAGKAHIGHGGCLARGLDQHRVVDVLRQAVLDLVDFGHDLGHGLVGIGIQLHPHRDDAAALGGRRRQVVDAFHRGHGLRDGLRDKALHQLGRCAGVLRGDGDGGAFGQRILPHRKAA